MAQQTVKLQFTAAPITSWVWTNWKSLTGFSSPGQQHYSAIAAGDVDGDKDIDVVGCIFSDGYGPLGRKPAYGSTQQNSPPNSLSSHVGACNLLLNNGAGTFTIKTGGIWGSSGEMAVDAMPAFLVDLDGDSDLVSARSHLVATWPRLPRLQHAPLSLRMCT